MLQSVSNHTPAPLTDYTPLRIEDVAAMFAVDVAQIEKVSSSQQSKFNTMENSTTDRDESIIALMKSEILADIKSGTVPKTIRSFSDLHDHVDANAYGGFTADGYKLSDNMDYEFGLQQKVDEWIKSDDFHFQMTTL